MEPMIEKLVRDNIRRMRPYSSARKEYNKTGNATIFLDANENAFGSPLPHNYNRYPDPLQTALREKIASVKRVAAANIFTGNGSDEAIDLLFRIFCTPGKDNVLIFPPTYGMYEVCAAVNDIGVKQIPLTAEFQLNVPAALKATDKRTRMIFICSPNNPTGNCINENLIVDLLDSFNGLIVIDEAYIDYAAQQSCARLLNNFPRLVIIQTLSKAWGLAGLRLGIALASEEIIGYMDKVKYPYNVNIATQQLAIEALDKASGINNWVSRTLEQRSWLETALNKFDIVSKVYPSDANFLLVKIQHAKKVYDYLVDHSIIVRDRSSILLCDDCLRITVGTPAENKQLISTLEKYTA